MKAAVWHKQKDVRIEDLAEPELGPHQVKVRIKTCGICGSDLHEFQQGPFIIPGHPHPLTGRQGGPVILGHELSAEVVECGADVTEFKSGDRVTVNPLICCDQCFYCRRGMLNMCTKLGTIGFAADGGFAEKAVFEAHSLYHLPDTVSDEMGAFVEPLAVAVHAVKRSRLKIGDSVAVVGAGPIGLLVLQVCLSAGASRVFTIEPLAARRNLAKQLGSAAVFDPTQEDAGKAIAELTDGLRANVVFDCVGNQSAFNTAVKASARRGIICVVGLSLESIDVPFIRLWGHEKELIFTSGYENEFPVAIGFLSDQRVEVKNMISKRIRLDDLVEKGFLCLRDAPEKNIKILVFP